MSKKGRIIVGIILALLAVAVVAVLVTTNLRRAAQEINFTEFITYVENAQYVDDEGKLKDGDTLPEELQAQGYILNKDGKVVKVVDEKEVPIIVIRKVNVSAYEYIGYIQNNSNAKAQFSAFGPSIYSAEGLGKVEEWKDFGVSVAYANPNANNWMSTAF